MTPPLTMVISWLMEYSLRYDLPQLKSELKDLFPNLVVLDKLEIPDKKTLVDLATLRLIVNRCLIKLVNRIREHLYITGKSLSEALIFASTNLQYDNRLVIVHENCKLRIPSEHVVYTNCCFCFDIQNNVGSWYTTCSADVASF